MSANFTPDQKGYKTYKSFGTFRLFVLENFPFIAEDFDALTYYQMLCKIVGFLQDVITNNESLQYNQTELLDAFNELQDYVNTYFNSLDIQTEINNKLDQMAQDGTLAKIINQNIFNELNSQISILNSVVKNVKSFGAVGDGVTDDTMAIVSALNSLNNGESLYFPAGDYIVYNDYVANTTNPSYPIEKTLKLVSKKNITIFGCGTSSRIRPSNQGISATKVYYPVTLTIDKCENIEIYGLNIQSKGENYGDADAGSSVAQSYRQQFCMSNAGLPLFVSGSKNINIHDCEARLCGSVSCFYFSDNEDVIVNNCFANTASYGYAGLNTDTFSYQDVSKKNNYIINNFVMHAEKLLQPENISNQIGKSECAGKGGIIAEGNINIVLNMQCNNCNISDVFGNSSTRYSEGYGFSFQFSNFYLNNCKTNNCFSGVKIFQNQTLINGNIINCLLNCKYVGVYFVIAGTNVPSSPININDNIINIDMNSEVPENSVKVYTFKPCFGFSETYSTFKLTAKNNQLNGNYTCYFPSNISYLYFINNIVNCVYGIYGRGGNFTINNNTFNLSNLLLNLIPYDENLTVSNINLILNNNTINMSNFENNAISIESTRNDLFKILSIQNNKFINCFIASQHLLNIKSNEILTPLLVSSNFTGEYSELEFNYLNNIMPFILPIVFDNKGNTIKALSWNYYNQTTGMAKINVPGNVTSQFTANNKYSLIQ